MPRSKRHWLGQHFLKDSRVIQRIVDCALKYKNDKNPGGLLEIGPGRGALTIPLMRAMVPFEHDWMLVERDPVLAAQIPEIVIGVDAGKIVRKDFLDCKESDWNPRSHTTVGVVSNLPYSAGTAILLKLLESKPSIAFMVLMFQKEVAQRLLAAPNSSDRSSLSLWVQNEWDVAHVLNVPPSAFVPPPKVESEVVVLTPRPVAQIPETLASPTHRTRWGSLLRQAFSQRRQMLRRVFRSHQDLAKIDLQSLGIDGERRAQSLDWADWGKLFRALIVLLTVTFTQNAEANIRETFGLGSGLSTLQSPSGLTAYSAENNPALLPQKDRPSLRLSYGLLWIRPMLSPIQNVVTSNATVADASPSQTGQVDVDYASTFGQLVGAEWSPFSETSHGLSFGLTTYAPWLQLGLVDSGEAYLPEFVLLRARTQRPEVSLAAGLRLSDTLSVGAGLRMAFTVASRATAFIKSQSGSNASSMRISSTVAPLWVPYLGLHWSSRTFASSFVARAAAQSAMSFSLLSSAQVIGDLTGLALSLNGTSVLLYDPASLEWGASLRISEHLTWRLQLDYQIWRAYRSPTMTLSNATTGGGVVIAPSFGHTLALQNILSPRTSLEFPMGPFMAEVSYLYRPSIFSAPPVGNSNHLDPPRHRVFLSLQRLIGRVLLELHGQVLLLVPQSIVKTSSDEIGAPGYTAGGWLGGGGISFSLGI